MRQILLTKAQFVAWQTFSGDSWAPFKEAWLARGFFIPPEGDPRDDPRTSLRSRLWEIAQARPNDLGRWVAEAKGRTQREVMTHVFAQWRGFREEIPSETDFDDVKLVSRYEEHSAARNTWTRIGDVLR